MEWCRWAHEGPVSAQYTAPRVSYDARMFQWTHAYIGEEGPKTSYRLDGVEIARLTRRIDSDTWIALLKQHRVAEPRIVRQCSSFEAGQRGVEMWADRHRERLQVDVDKINALRRQKQARIGGL